jgi:DNA-binding NarL/FixJ family response regulator
VLLADDHPLMLRMPGIDGLACLDRIIARHPQTKVVVLTVSADPDHAQAAFKHGACGYIVKGIDVHDLPSAINQAVDGTAYHVLGLPALNEDSAANSAGPTERLAKSCGSPNRPSSSISPTSIGRSTPATAQRRRVGPTRAAWSAPNATTRPRDNTNDPQPTDDERK